MTVSVCDALLDADLLPNCQETATGFEKQGILINWEDIDVANITYKTGTTNVVETLPLVSTKKGFKVVQKNKAFDGTQTTAVIGTHINTFTNEVHLALFDNGPKAAEQAKQIANGKFVLVVEQKQKNLKGFTLAAGESAYRIYGLECGLELSEASNNPSSEEIGNGWSFTLTETNASEAAIYLFKTDFATTKAEVDSLL